MKDKNSPIEELFSHHQYKKDANKTIWKDLYSSQSINLYNRNLQKGYVNILINLMNENQTQLSYYRRYGSNVKFDESDIRPIVLAELINLEKKTFIHS